MENAKEQCALGNLTEKKPKSDWCWSPDSIDAHLRRLEKRGIWIIRDAIEDDAGLVVFLAIDSRADWTNPGWSGR